jgi:uncharacterized protein (DUF2336 family)
VSEVQHAPEPVENGSAVRVRRAASAGTTAFDLSLLARDPDVLVRAAVAINRGCAPDVDRVLVQDGDERVRALLAGRIARLIPELTQRDQDDAAEHVRAMLLDLVQDAAVRVRAAIAEAVKSMPEAPRELILRLAQDTAAPVSDPVIRLSPVLTDADLLGLLATPPHPQADMAVAARPGLSAKVADAIAEHASAPAIQVMLANPSAQIRESTLDALVDRAAAYARWHGSLVRRPALSPQSARVLATFVAGPLLEVLAQRNDLEPAAKDSVQTQIMAGLTQQAHEPDDTTIVTELLRLKAAKSLDESVLLNAARGGELRRAAGTLAVASGIPLATIDRAIDLRSAKALVSLAWRAGFSMQGATVVQSALGQLAPSNMLAPGPNGGFPLSEEEMGWQLELLKSPARRAPVAERSKAWT